jgi:hypothetical protein
MLSRRDPLSGTSRDAVNPQGNNWAFSAVAAVSDC